MANKDIPLGISFKLFEKGEDGATTDGFAVFYNEGLDKVNDMQQSVAFAYPIKMIDSPEKCMHLISGEITSSLNMIIEKIIEKHSARAA